VTGLGPCRLHVFGIVASSEGTNDRTRSSSHSTRGKHLAWPRRNALLPQLLCWSILASKAEGHTFERCRTRQLRFAAQERHVRLPQRPSECGASRQLSGVLLVGRLSRSSPRGSRVVESRIERARVCGVRSSVESNCVEVHEKCPGGQYERCICTILATTFSISMLRNQITSVSATGAVVRFLKRSEREEISAREATGKRLREQIMSLWWAAMRFYIEPLMAIAFVWLVAVVLGHIVTGGTRRL